LIYSIGYQKHTLDTLTETLKRHGVEVLVDVRSRPFSRKREFNRPALAAWFHGTGIDYTWCGDVLGGFAPIPDSAIQWLADLGRDRTVCIMCMEADPDRCHRKTEIAKRLEVCRTIVEHIKTGC
jgi:uncharacterized protein (DUF488 family)